MRSSYDYRFGSWQLKEVHPLTALPNGHNWTHGHWGVLSYVDARERDEMEGQLIKLLLQPHLAFKKMEDEDGF